MSEKKLIILDRDGVINFDAPEFVKSPEEWRAIPGSLEAIALLKSKGYLTAIATNQSGVGRGYFSKQTLVAIHAKLLAAVRAAGGEIVQIKYCPHLPTDNCFCRKPKPGLLLELITELQIDPMVDTVFAVGDSARDIESALAAYCKPILVKTGNGEKTSREWPAGVLIPVYADLLEFVKTLP